ncbi:MAG: prolipoprotein diacylglyceryl transferase [Methylobacteriaceae bacterium]|jgi:phosphatidylglycerol:prolipoprotein diacylglycerol transferase|nr:prolipoprotein diacylglyceryl transferase [Methylobacteriaceae bacterium]
MLLPDFDPVAFSLGPLTVRWYGLAYLAGILCTWHLCLQFIRRDDLWGTLRRPTSDDIADAMVAATAGIILGGRLAYVLFYKFPYYAANPAEIPAVWDGGMAFHGGVIGCGLAIWIVARFRRISPLAFLDMVVCGAPIGLFFGRLANFVNGELWGRVAAPDFPLAFIFPYADDQPRHPSQLYEAFFEGVVLFVIMQWAVRRFGFTRPGLLSGLFAAGYAVLRIGCEFFREPDVQLGYLFGGSFVFLDGGITMGMVLSFVLLVAGIVVMFLAARGKTLTP